MIEIQHVLCPVDFSETSRHALEHAMAVAKWYDARVTVLHVIHPLLVLNPPVLFVEASRETALSCREGSSEGRLSCRHRAASHYRDVGASFQAAPLSG